MYTTLSNIRQLELEVRTGILNRQFEEELEDFSVNVRYVLSSGTLVGDEEGSFNFPAHTDFNEYWELISVIRQELQQHQELAQYGTDRAQPRFPCNVVSIVFSFDTVEEMNRFAVHWPVLATEFEVPVLLYSYELEDEEVFDIELDRTILCPRFFRLDDYSVVRVNRILTTQNAIDLTQ